MAWRHFPFFHSCFTPWPVLALCSVQFSYFAPWWQGQEQEEEEKEGMWETGCIKAKVITNLLIKRLQVLLLEQGRSEREKFQLDSEAVYQIVEPGDNFHCEWLFFQFTARLPEPAVDRLGLGGDAVRQFGALAGVALARCGHSLNIRALDCCRQLVPPRPDDQPDLSRDAECCKVARFWLILCFGWK